MITVNAFNPSISFMCPGWLHTDTIYALNGQIHERMTEAMYVRNVERYAPLVRLYFVVIDLAENSIETYKSLHRLPNNIRPMKKALAATEMVFSGDRNDNYFYNIKSDSYFHMTKGVDHYHIDNMSIANLVVIYITFDYAKINEDYTDNDRIIIYLVEYSGYDFFFENNELVHKDKKMI
ncbi:MAG: hypothetical protein ACL7BU_12575 [Candidatus Phlomobacter fragariae]